MESTRGVEVGHIFKLGTFFSESLGAYYLDTEGQQQPITMGCYGIGVSRILAAAIEQNHDERGIVFPPPIAPYQVYLVGLNMSDENVAKAAGELYDGLWAAGIETLFDDREDAAAGVKFNGRRPDGATGAPGGESTQPPAVGGGDPRKDCGRRGDGAAG